MEVTEGTDRAVKLRHTQLLVEIIEGFKPVNGIDMILPT